MAEIPSSRKYVSNGSRPAPSSPVTSFRATPASAAATVRSASTPPVASTQSKQTSGMLGWLVVALAIGLFIWWYFGRGTDLPYVAYPAKQAVHVIPTASVNARVGPGTEYPIHVQVAPNTALWALGTAQDSNGDAWIAIEKADGTAAYIKGKLLMPGK